MNQLNIYMTPAFEKSLKRLMKLRRIPTKTEAIYIAVNETLEHSIQQFKAIDFSTWIGLARQAPTNTKPKFKSDNDL